MPERTPARIADTFVQQLEQQLWTRRDRVSLACDSKDEAVLVVQELRERGWRAKIDLGTLLHVQKGAKVVTFVIVSGRSTRAQQDGLR